MRHVIVLGLTLAALACGGYAQEGASPSAFARTIEALSEPGGFFDTDNLISNERSYLHVMGALQRERVAGGAYVGVGPDQNFSYIAAIQPRIAYIVDIRRDNMLLHLLFKALFELAPTRAEFLSLLLARTQPDDTAGWTEWSVEALVTHFDTASTRAGVRAPVDSALASFAVELTPEDWETIERFHGIFMRAGMALRFTTFGRAARSYYPTYRDLLLETTRDGERANYLASHDRYDIVRRLQLDDRIVPVVGDFAGTHALRAVARDVQDRGLAVSGFYVSNVEFYLFGDRTFDRFVENLRSLPITDRSVIVRSLFRNPYGGRHPEAVPGYYSTQLVQHVDDLLRATDSGELRSYFDLIRRYVPN